MQSVGKLAQPLAVSESTIEYLLFIVDFGQVMYVHKLEFSILGERLGELISKQTPTVGTEF